nr:hypothetical protein [Candidatus Sigynarchaeota archaeon]
LMEGGLHVSYFGSMASKGHDAGWYGRVHVFGEKGCAYRDASGQPYVYLDGKSEPIGLDDKYEDDLDEYLPLIEFEKVAYVLEDFYHAIKDNRQPVTDIHDNLNTLAIVLAMKKAAMEKRVVDVRREYPLP